MKKKWNERIPRWGIRFRKIVQIMKWTFMLLFISCMHLSAAVYSQQERMDISVRDISVEQLIKTIKLKMEVDFLYNIKEIERNGSVSLEMKNATVEEILQEAFRGKLLTYSCVNGVFIIRPVVTVPKDSVKKMYLIKGKVLDAKKQPLPGVTIRLDSTIVGTVSNMKGEFTMDLPQEKGKLIFSFVGFKMKKVPFVAGKQLVVTLEEDIADLDEVTVIGYGERNRREIVSSISSVKGDDIKEIPTSSFTNLLQGRMAGVQVTNQSGSPGGGGTFVAIRGYNSLMVSGASDGQPLYVIDGVPMHSFTSPVTGTNALAELDPLTIESVEVLKDAAAAAIYGSRAGNGVILITTRKGKMGKATFSANVSYTASIMPKFPLQLGGRAERWWKIQRMRHVREAQYDWSTKSSFYPESYREAYERGGQYDEFWNAGDIGSTYLSLQDSLNPFYNNQTNWWKQMFRTGRVLNANVQASGGKPGIRYMVGMGYYTETGIMYSSDFKRANFIANLSLQPAKRISFDTRFYLAYSDKSRNTKDNSFAPSGSIESMTSDPMQTETLLPAGGEVEREVLQKLNGTVARDDSYRMMLNAMLGLDIIKGLKFTASLGLDFSQNNSNVFEPSYLNYQGENKSTGLVYRDIGITQENLLRYERNINDVHRFELLAGITYTENQHHGIQGFAMRGASDNIYYVDGNHPDTHDYGTPDYPSVQALKQYSSDYTQQIMVSYLGRIAYNYKLKYLMEVTYRRDGSSAFGEDVRYANFPSIALGWSFGEEAFVKNWVHWLDMGKIRASWGTSGQTLTDPYLAHGLINIGGTFMGNQGTTAPMINRRLSWEKSDQYDFGLDLDMFNYRLKMKLDYYYKYTKSLLYEVVLPGDVLGNSRQWQNAMEVSNEGIELELIGDIISKRDWSWRTRFNISRNWNRFEKSYSGMDELDLVIGRPLRGIYVYDDTGFVQNQKDVPLYSNSDGTVHYMQTPELAMGQYYIPGMRQIKDIDGDGRIGDGDKYYAGTTLPMASGGWVNELRWKNFDLNLLFAYTLGRKMINGYAQNSLYSGEPILLDYRKQTYWQKEGDQTDLAAIGLADNYSVRSRIEKVNYLRLKTLSLGYNVPAKALKRSGLSGIRIFFTGENLFLWTNYSGLDPEVVSLGDGVDGLSSYPLDRKFTLGLTVNF